MSAMIAGTFEQIAMLINWIDARLWVNDLVNPVLLPSETQVSLVLWHQPVTG